MRVLWDLDSDKATRLDRFFIGPFKSSRDTTRTDLIRVLEEVYLNANAGKSMNPHSLL